MTTILDKIRKIIRYRHLVVWFIEGRPSPPPHLYKQIVVKQYQRRYNIPLLVETGTYLGDMVDAVKRGFSQIYSIELDEALAERAARQFSTYDHIHIVCGDSSAKLPNVLSHIDGPCLF